MSLRTPFATVGRSSDVGEIVRLMSRSRLLTLTGTIGVGKSALAFEVARYRRAAFTDGVLMIDLARSEPAITSEVLGRTLVVLDNCERAIEVAAQLAHRLLSAHHGVRVLATSLELLRLPGETVFTVRPRADPVVDAAGLAEAALARCDRDERDLCARLAIFRGPFDLRAAEHVAAGSGASTASVVELVASLVDKSVLTRTEIHGQTCYALPPGFQGHGRARISGRQRTRQASERLTEWYRTALATAAAEFFTGRQLAALTLLRAKLPDVAAALDHCAADRQDAPTGLEIATALASYWPAVGRRQTPIWLSDALTRYDGRDVLRGRGLAAASRIAVRSAQPGLARSMTDELGELLQRHPDPRLRVEHTELTGLIRLHDGRTAEAVALLERASAEYEGVDDVGRWRASTQLALAAGDLGRPDRAGEAAEAGLALACGAGAQWSVSISLCVAALQHWRCGRVARAALLAREALEVSRTALDLHGQAACLELLAWITVLRDQHRAGARLLGAASAVAGQPAPTVLPGLDRGHEWCVRRLVRAIGERAYRTAYQAGAGYPVQEAVRLALKVVPVTAVPHRRDAGPLTARELEVARAVAAGMTNREVAFAFAVTERTVEAHLVQIQAKLALTSRAQVAVWVARLGR